MNKNLASTNKVAPSELKSKLEQLSVEKKEIEKKLVDPEDETKGGTHVESETSGLKLEQERPKPEVVKVKRSIFSRFRPVSVESKESKESLREKLAQIDAEILAIQDQIEQNERAPLCPEVSMAATLEERTLHAAGSEAINTPKDNPVENTSTSEAVVIPSPQSIVTAETLKPATWTSKEPSTAWCPEEVRPHLPYAAELELKYRNDLTEDIDLPGGWKLIAATRRGKMHAHNATHREDAYHIEIGSNFFVANVCDGAGSYKYSRVGSETTCREVTRRLKERIESSMAELSGLDAQAVANKLGEMLNLSVFETCNFLEELAQKSGCQKKDFRCTLLLVMVYRLADSELILSCHVGDGFIAGLDRYGAAQRYGTADSSGDFSGEVKCFIPDENAPVTARDSIMPIKSSELEALIICSDGIEDPFYPLEKKASRIFQQLYFGVSEKLDGFASQPVHGPVIGLSEPSKTLGEWLGFEKKGENDDRTILVLHKNSPTFDRSQIIAS